MKEVKIRCIHLSLTITVSYTENFDISYVASCAASAFRLDLGNSYRIVRIIDEVLVEEIKHVSELNQEETFVLLIDEPRF